MVCRGELFIIQSEAGDGQEMKSMGTDTKAAASPPDYSAVAFIQLT